VNKDIQFITCIRVSW